MPSTKLITTLAVPAALIMAPGLSSAQAQNYPTRPVTIIVSAPAGGGIDLIARVV